jgi:hypothetical protein
MRSLLEAQPANCGAVVQARSRSAATISPVLPSPLDAVMEADMGADPDNPLPDFIDPITLETVVRPTVSPQGFVMGCVVCSFVRSFGVAHRASSQV